MSTYLFSKQELRLMETALTHDIEKNGDDTGAKTELRNDLRLCIAGKL
jgi:hypothetical protein